MGWLSTFFGRSDRKAKEASDRSVGPQPVETAPRGELSDPLSLLAEQRGERDQFLRRLVSDGVWILALAPGSEFDPKSPDELLGHIREQARGLSQNRIGRPYMYSRAGSSVLPVFSTREAAEEFIKRLRITKATAFQCLQVRPGFWLANTFGLTRVFFNPFSNVQMELSETDLRRVRLAAEQMERAH